MSFFDYLRNFFSIKHRDEPGTSGLGDNYSYRHSFRNPIWQNDEDDDDIDDFRHPGNSMNFNIFSDPFEITRYFESEMDNMLKNFFGFNGFSSFPGHNDAIRALPERDANLRGDVLKPKSDSFMLSEPNFSIAPHQKVDTDLDGKITAKEFSRIWNHGDIKTEEFAPRNFSFGKSVTKKIIRRPDGSIEEKHIIRDSEGNQETKVLRGIGDKRHIVTIKENKNGIESKSEDLINMDENELKDFNRKWLPSIKDDSSDRSSNLNRFPWKKFFGPDPKL